MPPKAGAGKLSLFNRNFDPEFLAARKDIPPVMLQCALGDFEAVSKHLTKADEYEVFNTNRDGNNLLLIAIANKHLALTNLLLEMKSDIFHKNSLGLDALDYATMDGIRNPIAKCVLNHCDFIVPEVLDTDYWMPNEQALTQLQQDKVWYARSSLIGKVPNFGEKGGRDTEYAQDWLKNFHYLVHTVKKGVLLLSSEIGYLERDAMLTGCLDMPLDRRFLYRQAENKVMSFRNALRRDDVYAGAMGKRVLEACAAGETQAVQGLLKAGASPNGEDLQGNTALMRAARLGEVQIVRCLLVAKARVDAASKDGFTALLLAAVGNHADTARLLLRAKADVQKKSCKGHSVLDFVRHEGCKEILTVIRQEGKKTVERRGTSQTRRSASRGPRA